MGPEDDGTRESSFSYYNFTRLVWKEKEKWREQNV